MWTANRAGILTKKGPGAGSILFGGGNGKIIAATTPVANTHNNPANAYDGSPTTYSESPNVLNSPYSFEATFMVDLSDIPAGAVVTGVEVYVSQGTNSSISQSQRVYMTLYGDSANNVTVTTLNSQSLSFHNTTIGGEGDDLGFSLASRTNTYQLFISPQAARNTSGTRYHRVWEVSGEIFYG